MRFLLSNCQVTEGLNSNGPRFCWRQLLINLVSHSASRDDRGRKIAVWIKLRQADGVVTIRNVSGN